MSVKYCVSTSNRKISVDILCLITPRSLLLSPSPSQALVTMTPDQRRESIGLSNIALSDKEDKTKAYTLEEFSYDYFRCVS